MAAKPHTVHARPWKTTFKKYQILAQRLDHARPNERDALERAVAAQQDALLDTSAPDLAAVRDKLLILWEGELDGLDQTSEEKRLVLEDIADLLAEQDEPSA